MEQYLGISKKIIERVVKERTIAELFANVYTPLANRRAENVSVARWNGIDEAEKATAITDFKRRSGLTTQVDQYKNDPARMGRAFAKAVTFADDVTGNVDFTRDLERIVESEN